MRHTFAEKRQWVLDRLSEKREYDRRVYSGYVLCPSISATDQEDQEAWVEAFGGKEKIYTMGPNVSPDFSRTLRRMFQAGDLVRTCQGNQDAKSYGQKTYYFAYMRKDHWEETKRSRNAG